MVEGRPLWPCPARVGLNRTCPSVSDFAAATSPFAAQNGEEPAAQLHPVAAQPELVEGPSIKPPAPKQKGAAPQCHPFVVGWFRSRWDQNLNTTVPLIVRGAPIWTKPGEP